MLTPTRRLFVRRRGYGLGAPCIDDPSIDCGDPGVTLATTNTASAQGGGFDWTSIITPLAKAGATIGMQFASYQNPLYNKATYYQSPQGAIYASNVPSSGFPGGFSSSGGLGSMLPILLIGGVALLMISRR